jgi:putative FmdB family regulatory protein
MALYTYKCDTCEQVFETSCRLGDDLKNITCPQGHKRVHRLFTPPAIMFKGSGFYATDSQLKNKSSEQPGQENIKNGS